MGERVAGSEFAAPKQKSTSRASTQVMRASLRRWAEAWASNSTSSTPVMMRFSVRLGMPRPSSMFR